MYQLSVYLHLLAAIIWVGGMFFLSLVVIPALRGRSPAERGALISAVGRRFRVIGWICIAILVVSGLANAAFRGVSVENFGRLAASSQFGLLLAIKLGLVAVLVALSAVHDFVLGPASTRALERGAGAAPEADRLRRRAAILARVEGILALLVVAIAVLLVRGLPPAG